MQASFHSPSAATRCVQMMLRIGSTTRDLLMRLAWCTRAQANLDLGWKLWCHAFAFRSTRADTACVLLQATSAVQPDSRKKLGGSEPQTRTRLQRVLDEAGDGGSLGIAARQRRRGRGGGQRRARRPQRAPAVTRPGRLRDIRGAQPPVPRALRCVPAPGILLSKIKLSEPQNVWHRESKVPGCFIPRLATAEPRRPN